VTHDPSLRIAQPFCLHTAKRETGRIQDSVIYRALPNFVNLRDSKIRYNLKSSENWKKNNQPVTMPVRAARSFNEY